MQQTAEAVQLLWHQGNTNFCPVSTEYLHVSLSDKHTISSTTNMWFVSSWFEFQSAKMCHLFPLQVSNVYRGWMWLEQRWLLLGKWRRGRCKYTCFYVLSIAHKAFPDTIQVLKCYIWTPEHEHRFHFELFEDWCLWLYSCWLHLQCK